MTIKINLPAVINPPYVRDVMHMRDGETYIDEKDNDIFIVNKCDDIVAYSLDGRSVIFRSSKASDYKLHPVNLEVTVTYA